MADEIKQLVSLIAPGLIIVEVRNKVLSSPPAELSVRLLSYAAISAAYYAVASPIFSVPTGVKLDFWLWSLGQYFLVPLCVGVAAAYASQYEIIYRLAAAAKLNLAHHIPAAWDYAFSKLKSGTFLLVTMSDGSQVAGLMGRSSFASSSKEERDLLLESVWEVSEAGEWTPALPPKGVLLCGKDIKYVEIFERQADE